jgi:D-alanine-D-alanine ligase
MTAHDSAASTRPDLAPFVPEITPGWVTWTSDFRRAQLEATPIVVLLGGTSGERDVSLTSGQAMADALVPLGDPQLPLSTSVVEIDPQGLWIVDGVALPPTTAIDRLPANALFLLGLHGGDGEGGTLQGFLEISGRAYTGSSVAASALCLDKVLSRSRFVEAGAHVASGLSITRVDWANDRRGIVQRIQDLGSAPWYVKPVHGGSSLMTSRIQEPHLLEPMIETVLAAGDSVLVERGVAGVEVTVGVIGDERERRALPVVEIRPRDDEWFDYEQKYSAEGAEEICPPKSLSEARCLEIQDLALAIWDVAGLEGYARIDFIAPAHGGPPVILEANTLPGFTSRSLLPLAALAHGVGFRDLLLEICSRGLNRRSV